MSEKFTYNTTIVAGMEIEMDESDLESFMEKAGIETREEFLKFAEQKVESDIRDLLEGDALYYVGVLSKEGSVSDKGSVGAGKRAIQSVKE